MPVNSAISTNNSIEQGSVLNKRLRSHNSDSSSNRLRGTVQEILVELIGTTFFILIGLFGVCTEKRMHETPLTGALAFGLSLMMFAASFTHISGAHFNPAVTVGMLIAGAIEIKKAFLYILMQLIGGVLAAGIFRLLSLNDVYHQCRGGATTPMGIINIDRVEWWEGLIIELLLTFAFVTVILLVSFHPTSKSLCPPIYIGLCLAACILAGSSTTGGSLNPARSLGPAIFANVWTDHYIYWVGPILGGLLAGGNYRFLWYRERD